MRTILTQPRMGFGVAAAAVLLLCGLSQVAVAADSRLAVRQTNKCDFYALDAIERITYGEDELNVTTAEGTDTYALEAIVRVDFIPDSPTVSVGGPEDEPMSANPPHLFQNQPNPFSPDTQIAFDLPLAGRAELRIYDVKGRLIRTLVDGELPAGLQIVRWDGRDETGRVAASGIYFYSLTAPQVNENRKMILAK